MLAKIPLLIDGQRHSTVLVVTMGPGTGCSCCANVCLGRDWKYQAVDASNVLVPVPEHVTTLQIEALKALYA